MEIKSGQNYFSIKPKAIAGYAYFCGHCGEPIGARKYCDMCRTKAGRAEVDKLNEEINENNN